jgi:predicted NBD/HSP70 family sugar kinase
MKQQTVEDTKQAPELEQVQALRGKDIRNRNEKLVLYQIFRGSGVSQPEIAEITGLRPPTVLRIFSNLIDRGLIINCDERRTSPDRRGRKPTYYCTNPEAHYCIGIDFWSESAHATVIDFQGSVIHTDSVAFGRTREADEVVETLASLASRCIKRLSLPRQKILGVGIGTPGRVDVERGRILYYSGVEGMTDFDIKHRLEERLNLPTVIHNTCSVIASSQYRYGRAAHARSLCAVTVRSGVGASLVTGGEVFLSQNKTILEVGHMSLNANEEPWKSGDTGRLESELSEGAILEALQSVAPIKSMEEVDALIDGGDSKAKAVLAEKAKIVAILIWNLFQLIGPELFIIITRSRRLSEYLARHAEGALLQDPFVRQNSEVRVLGDEYDPLIACRGAADLVLDTYFAAP